MERVSLKFIIDFFTDKSIVTTIPKSNILELFQYSDEKCEKKFNDFIDLILFIIDSDYDLNAMSNKKNYLHTIKDDIINYIQDSQLLINKPKIISQIKNNDLTQDIILLICYIFDINIIIHENNILKVYYFSEKFNKYRNTILLKVEQDDTDGTEYYKLLLNNDQFMFNKNDKNLIELLEKEFIIPIGFIPNKTFSFTDDKYKLINDRLVSEIFMIKQILEVKDASRENKKDHNSVEGNNHDKQSNTNKVLTDDDDDDDIYKVNDDNAKYMMDYTNMNYEDELESDDD
jgi:hypothetical protein